MILYLFLQKSSLSLSLSLSLSENDYTQIAIPPTPKWFTELNVYAYLTSILRGWFLIMISWKWLLKIVCTEDGSKVIVFWAFVCAFFKTWFISVWTTCTYNKYLCWWRKKIINFIYLIVWYLRLVAHRVF